MAGRCDVLVVGAGLAGLAAAHHLGEGTYRIVEREREAGGLCRSVRRNGFTFDYTGHLLHLRRPEIRDLVLSLLGESAFLKIDRRSGIHSHGTYTEYPFQVNTFGLPRKVVRECVMGFADTLQSEPDLGEDPSFHDWALATFGRGISDHFLLPYNEKLFRADLRTVSADWVSWSIPKPGWEDVVRGALGRYRKEFGYNPHFLYPAEGGIDHLPRALLPGIRSPELGTAVVAVNASRREATLSTGEVVRYEAMISTAPLPTLLRQIADAPPELVAGAGALRHVSVLNLNLGFDAPCLQPYHWVYFPEARFPFYRVGVYSNLCPAAAPEGQSGYYVEISHRPGEALDADALARRCADQLREAGLVARSARLTEVCAIDISHAYVVHDRRRREVLELARSFLASRGILSVGRYGSWEYSAMEDALWQGRSAAEQVSKR